MRKLAKNNSHSFSQKHPFLFGMMLIMAAVALFAGAMAALRLFDGPQSTGSLFQREKVAILTVSGFIKESGPVVEYARQLRLDNSVKGVLVRINSPGGAVAPSQEMYQAVQRLAAVKPVVVSMGTVAASGGYYIAVGANTIVANPATITGSIGVKMEMPNFQELMGKVGVRHVAFVSGKLKNAGSPFASMSDDERAYLQDLVMDMYEQFITAVAKGRKMSLDSVKEVADGRAITGRKAKEYGLVDYLGDQETAMSILLKQCGAEEPLPVVEGPVKAKTLLEQIVTSSISLPSSVSFGESIRNSLEGTMRRRSAYEFLSY